MLQMFANLPDGISTAIAEILSQAENKQWIKSAKELHERYMTRENETHESFIQNPSDVLAYLGMRSPATYAQIYGAGLQVQELYPSWNPTSLLDIGGGPGTAIWAAKTLWPTLKKATSIDHERYFQFIGKEIAAKSSLDIEVTWQYKDLRNNLDKNDARNYDVVIIANVLNELSPSEREHLVTQAYNRCQGIFLIIEPGTPLGFDVIQTTAEVFAHKDELIAPYIPNSFVQSHEYWIHFTQRFIRPEFQRRIRQQMRNSPLMASDWEEAKYSYVAFSKIPTKQNIWGRIVSPIAKQKGFVEIPVLTEKEVIKVKVMKRHKKEYAFAKNLVWGDIIRNRSDILYTE